MRRKQGISLIVLVITIIVMVILAASVIISLNNAGIINKANDAVDKTNASEVQNLATLAWAEEFMSGKRGDSLKEAVLDALKDYTDKYDVEVSDTGVSVNKKGEGTANVVDWDAILADANANPNKYKHPDQTESEDIGIGTDGKPVNMDYWFARLYYGELTLASLRGSGQEAGYMGPYTANGEIYGKVPQYILLDGKTEFAAVVSMYDTFECCTNLKIAPEIPASVVNMSETFQYCENLTTAPEIPASVVDMYCTFLYCDSLTGDLIINANPTQYISCLYEASTKEGTNLKLSGTSTMLNQILNTKSEDSNISLK